MAELTQTEKDSIEAGKTFGTYEQNIINIIMARVRTQFMELEERIKYLEVVVNHHLSDEDIHVAIPDMQAHPLSQDSKEKDIKF